VIGAQRAGSTFLHDNLVHRTTARSSPLQKEVHFFDNKYYKGPDWYKKFFERRKKNKRKVKNFETSPYYIYHPAVPKRIKETIPDAKIIAILRDPVERSVSHYKWMKKIGIEKRDAIGAFKKDADKISKETSKRYKKNFGDPFHFDFDHIYRSYIRRSHYDVQISRWMRYFDESSIRVITSKTLFEDIEIVIKKIGQFVGVEYTGEKKGRKANKNSSCENIPVPTEARLLAKRSLEGVVDRLEKIMTDEMVLGDIRQMKQS
jgi:hypothetical protein